MLTGAKCRNATWQPGKKRQRLTDSIGLYLEISTAGSKRRFLKIYANGKEERPRARCQRVSRSGSDLAHKAMPFKARIMNVHKELLQKIGGQLRRWA